MSTLPPRAIVQRRAGVVCRQLDDGRAVLLDLASAGYFALNPVGTAVWELLDVPLEFETLVERLRTRVIGAPAGMNHEVSEFVRALSKRDLVQIVLPSNSLSMP